MSFNLISRYISKNVFFSNQNKRYKGTYRTNIDQFYFLEGLYKFEAHEIWVLVIFCTYEIYIFLFWIFCWCCIGAWYGCKNIMRLFCSPFLQPQKSFFEFKQILFSTSFWISKNEITTQKIFNRQRLIYGCMFQLHNSIYLLSGSSSHHE